MVGVTRGRGHGAGAGAGCNCCRLLCGLCEGVVGPEGGWVYLVHLQVVIIYEASSRVSIASDKNTNIIVIHFNTQLFFAQQ